MPVEFLIVGLGNPGAEYEFTPHNLGFMVIAKLAERHAIRVSRKENLSFVGLGSMGTKQVALAQPQTFMNLSGGAVKGLVERYEVPLDHLVLVYDELDLPLGTLRIRERGSSAGHNGMKSIIQSLGTQEFLRIRMGIAPETKILKPFRKALHKTVDGMIANAAEAVEVILKEGRSAAMNRFNRKAELEEKD